MQMRYNIVMFKCFKPHEYIKHIVIPQGVN